MIKRRGVYGPDYAGAIRNGIGENLNGTRTSSSNFQTPMGGGFNQQQGREFEARRRAAEAEAAPVRDKFNPAAAQAVVDTFGFGIGSDKKFKFDPLAVLSMALPVGKLVKAARAARAAGRAGEAAALEARIGAKFSGQLPATTSSGMYSPFGQDSRERLRQESLSLFPRLTPGTGNVMNASIQEVAQYLRKMQIDDIGRGTKFIKRPK